MRQVTSFRSPAVEMLRFPPPWTDDRVQRPAVISREFAACVRRAIHQLCFCPIGKRARRTTRAAGTTGTTAPV